MSIHGIVIYSSSITRRLDYACYLVFDVLLQVPFQITADKDFFMATTAGRVNYSAEHMDGSMVHVQPHPLLFQKNIEPFEPGCINWENQPLLFPVSREGFLPFDVFSAVFFMATRYEEYLPFTPDGFGRFPEKQAISGKYGFTHLPVAHIWAGILSAALRQLYPGWQPPVKKGSILTSFDIDVAYAFRGRPFGRHLLSFFKDMVRFDLTNIKAKIASGFGTRTDPSDTYAFIDSHPGSKIFFFLVAATKSRYDNNIPPSSEALKKLVTKTAKQYPVGIHPSYYSVEQNGRLRLEKMTLEKMTGQPVTQSRQHFLRLRMPQTYRALLEAGITDDYSMAYPEMPGFRAGICVPYLFFDLAANQTTSLLLHPTSIMETTFRDDLHLTAAESLPYFTQMLDKVMEVGGVFISIWHNDSLMVRRNEDHPLNFRKTFSDLMEYVRQKNYG